MTDVLETADRLFTGELDPADHHPFSQFGDLAEISATTAFVAAFANAAAFDTDDGLVVVDTSSPFLCGKVHEALRGWSADRLDTAVFTHGHIDHCFGVELYEAEAQRATAGQPPRVVAHEAIAARFDRYVETAGYNGDHQPAAVPHARSRSGRPSTATPTRPTATGSTSTSAASASSCTTPAARPTTTPGSGRRTARCSAPATSSSGRRRTAATRRRRSGTRSSGRARSTRWPRSSAEVLLPGPRPADRRRRPGARSALTDSAPAARVPARRDDHA